MACSRNCGVLLTAQQDEGDARLHIAQPFDGVQVAPLDAGLVEDEHVRRAVRRQFVELAQYLVDLVRRVARTQKGGDVFQAFRVERDDGDLHAVAFHRLPRPMVSAARAGPGATKLLVALVGGHAGAAIACRGGALACGHVGRQRLLRRGGARCCRIAGPAAASVRCSWRRTPAPAAAPGSTEI
jgi:hypothetical protein